MRQRVTRRPARVAQDESQRLFPESTRSRLSRWLRSLRSMSPSRALPLLTRHADSNNDSNGNNSTTAGESAGLSARNIRIGKVQDESKRRVGGENAVCNRKYNVLTFVPLVLYEQFRMFYNLFFLLVACSQFIPALRVGFFWTYFGPLVFVLLISVSKEAFDDYARYKRDLRLNMFAYTLLAPPERGDIATAGAMEKRIASKDISVGDILVLEKNERVPADCVLLRTAAAADDASPKKRLRVEGKPNEEGSESVDSAATQGGETSDDALFIRTDQLDGETDWKLRRPIAGTQVLSCDEDLIYCEGEVQAEPPKREIYDFVGTYIRPDGVREPLTVENTLWANTVVASGRAVCMVVYNGDETRSNLNASAPRSKVGKLDMEVNNVSKMLFALLVSLSAMLTILHGFSGQWILYFCRYFLLLSAIIPISMRVNLDMAKIAYTTFIEGDYAKMPGCTVRNSNLPEELGRVEYLLTDKTGTLTQNEMSFKKLHVGTVLFARDSLEDVRAYLHSAFRNLAAEMASGGSPNDTPLITMSPHAGDSKAHVGEDSLALTTFSGSGRSHAYARDSSRRKRIQGQVLDALLAIALAHNVTPVEENGTRAYQAASPDEVALVRFAESVGLVLEKRTLHQVVLLAPGGIVLTYDVLAEFPFTSESKRMGVVVRSRETDEIFLYVKGADSVLSRRVQYNDWLEEECGNLAREGLRTLVFARRQLSQEEYAAFADDWLAARTSAANRKEAMAAVQSSLEKDMDLLALTGVEDRLQPNVRETLEKLRHAGIRIWMLTGDKVETATCIAVSSRLAERSQGIFAIVGVTSRNEASRALSRFRQQNGSDVLIVDGTSLQTYLDMFPEDFIDVASTAPAAVACRCSPTQKAAVVQLLQDIKNKRVAAIGDGGNDVSMIQQAHAGIGIPGKEGMQASLAADFSITSFKHLTRLLLWHGRNSYRRSARLSQFVIHRGLIVSIIQTVYCALFFYAAVSVYSGWILVGYATVYTMFPVFSLIFDEDVSEHAADTYPELYKDLQKGRSLNLKTFLVWVIKSIYQGTIIMVFSVYVLWDDRFFTTMHLSAISFTSLILTELLMVASEIHRWHWMMIVAQLCSVVFYVASILILTDSFDPVMMFQWGFAGRVVAVTLVSCLPVTIGKWLKRRFAPAAYSKLA